MRRASSFTKRIERSMSMNHSAKNRVPRARWEKTLVCIVSLTAVLVTTRVIEARRLVSAAEARQLGLERSWLAQVSLDSARNRLDNAVLHGDRLTVMTTAGIMQELDALTGQTIWSARIGNPDHPSLGPAASAKAVAIINGSTLYVLDKADGKPLVVRRVGGAPGAAPAMAEDYVFVPLVTGRVEAYPIGEQKLTPWYYQSYGRAMVTPLATAESVVWTTDSGHMYVGRSKELGLRFRLETGSEILAQPASAPPYVYAATSAGEVFSMNEATGLRQWKYTTGFPIHRAPAAVGGRVFVTTDEPMLHAIDAKTGARLWEVPNITQFAAASKTRVYCVDNLGAMVVVDAATGAFVGRIYRDTNTRALVNDQTDRIYLVSDDGLVQCYHELGAKEPTYHQPKLAPAQPAGQDQLTQPGAARTDGVTQPQPPAEDAEEAAEPAGDDAFGDDAFGEADDAEMAEEPAEEEPAEDGAMEEEPADEADPFGAFGEE
jgi:outer membrane protein assembly factor BamB